MTKKKNEARRDQIIKAAKKVFAEKGYHEATISEIAREAGISEPTIYEYFPSKEEILFTIPGDTAARGIEVIEFSLAMAKGAANKLRVLIYLQLWLLQDDPEYASVSYLILKQSRRFIETENFKVLRETYRYFNRIIEEGIESGEFCSDFSPFFIRSLILGTIDHLTIRKVLYGTDDVLTDYVDPLIEMVTKGLKNVSTPAKVNLQMIIDPDSFK